MGDSVACERARDEAEKVRDLTVTPHNGGWLRFEGARLSEERGARYVQLGKLDLAERALQKALEQEALATGRSFRRRGAVLVNLAAIGVRRGDVDQLVHFASGALQLARETHSGYIARRLQVLGRECGSLARHGRVAELLAEIAALDVACERGGNGPNRGRAAVP